MKENINDFTLKHCVYLDYDLYSMQIWYTSVHFKLVDLETLQVIVKSYWQHTSLDETMKSSQPEFYANTSLSSQPLGKWSRTILEEF